MKKYWKSLAVLVIIVLGIGIFYIQSATAVKSFPNFTFEKEAGDDAEIKDVVLDGIYNLGNINEGITITPEKTTYSSERNFISNLFSTVDPEIERLQKDYRSFMRGKEEVPYLFYEDEQFLVYANVESDIYNFHPSTFDFYISVLDKKTKEKTSFKIPIPDRKAYSFVYAENVLMADGKISVVTTNDFMQGDRSQLQMHVYTFDLKEQKLLSDETVISLEDDEMDSESVYYNVYTTPLAGLNNGNYVVFRKEKTVETPMENGDTEFTVKDQELVSYDVTTGQSEKLNLPKELKEDASPIVLNENTIYFQRKQETKSDIIAYDLAAKKVVSNQSFDLGQFGGEEYDEARIAIDNDRIYIVSAYLFDQNEDAEMFVGDLKTGKTLYSGKIKPVNDKKMPAEQGLYIYELYINKNGK